MPGAAQRVASLRATGCAASRTTGPAVAPGWARASRYAPARAQPGVSAPWPQLRVTSAGLLAASVRHFRLRRACQRRPDFNTRPYHFAHFFERG